MTAPSAIKPIWKSLLFVSADDPARLEKAHSRGASALILDLEDAVPKDRKAPARSGLAGHIATLHKAEQTIIVRINSSWHDVIADLDASIIAGVTAIMLPKVEDAWRVQAIAEIITEFEEARNLPVGQIGLICLIESAAGLVALPQIVKAPRIIGLAVGSEDLSLTLNITPSAEFLDMPCRQIAMAASMTGVMAIGLPLSIAEFRDMDAYALAARRGASYGITSALCIHPAQVAKANEILGPSAEDIDHAQTVLAAWDAHGRGGVLQLDGQMIDLPVVLRAQNIIARA